MHPSSLFSTLIVSALFVAAAEIGCGGDDGNATTTTTTTTTTTSSSTGTGGNGGSGGGGVMPIDTPEGQWTYVPFPDAVCMTGTPTGIGVNKSSASGDVLIFLEGGNACFNLASCSVTANKNGYGDAEFGMDKSMFLDSAPIFSRASSALFKDYSFVYIPYCSGDVHAGDNDTSVAGTMRHFHGANNMSAYLKRIVATFPNAKHVLLTGESAGGFGALFNYDRVASAFPMTVDVKLLDDSGPPFAEMYSPACLQKAFKDTWGLDKTLPADCADCKQASGVFEEPFTTYLVNKWGKNRLALISSTEDHQIEQFLSFGNNNCAGLMGAPDVYPGPEYTMGLQDLRDRIVKGKNFKLFLLDGTDGSDKTKHVWLNDDWTKVSSNGVTLATWLNQLVTDDPAWASVPAQ